jgi:oligoendopeptidase F
MSDLRKLVQTVVRYAYWKLEANVDDPGLKLMQQSLMDTAKKVIETKTAQAVYTLTRALDRLPVRPVRNRDLH